VPTPNHDHVIDNSRVNATPIWCEVRPVLILDQSDWPAADGGSGITPSKAMDDAEGTGRALEVGSNFVLFLSSPFVIAQESLTIEWHASATDSRCRRCPLFATANVQSPLPLTWHSAGHHLQAERSRLPPCATMQAGHTQLVPENVVITGPALTP
jgi:hypothetical protein